MITLSVLNISPCQYWEVNRRSLVRSCSDDLSDLVDFNFSVQQLTLAAIVLSYETVPVVMVEATLVEATMLEGVEVGATPPGISAPTDTATNPQPERITPAAMNPPRRTIIFGYTPPSNSSFFQPQIQGVPNSGSQPFLLSTSSRGSQSSRSVQFQRHSDSSANVS